MLPSATSTPWKKSLHHCAWLALMILLQLLITLFLNGSLHPLFLHWESAAAACKHGRIYVYALPPILNKDLLHNYHAVSNGGLGPPATGLDAAVPLSLSAAWYWTDMYAAEVIYHDRINSYRCTTSNPAQAAAFYIPFYAGLAVRNYLFSNSTAKDRDRHAAAMLNWVKNQPAWRNSNGLLYMPLMKNVLRLTVERFRWDSLEFSVPYPTAFHPRSESDIRQWQAWIRASQRSSLFTFVGRPGKGSGTTSGASSWNIVRKKRRLVGSWIARRRIAPMELRLYSRRFSVRIFAYNRKETG
ncbi:hypothetical protein SASPL_158105 [Salvia splendens]|uniref:Exostosin GT47 domain-containing protein n=1 Tax=Salvia splendens TaxID=180675 RepID=A0A8X8VTU4_SALSN|nr:hypothetical protein SASPL_158105 [Salvia splendens]